MLTENGGIFLLLGDSLGNFKDMMAMLWAMTRGERDLGCCFFMSWSEIVQDRGHVKGLALIASLVNIELLSSTSIVLVNECQGGKIRTRFVLSLDFKCCNGFQIYTGVYLNSD